MRGFRPVMLGLTAVRITGQAALLAQGIELGRAASEHLVHIRLVGGIEDDGLARGLKDPVQRNGQFHHAQIGPQVPTRHPKPYR